MDKKLKKRSEKISQLEQQLKQVSRLKRYANKFYTKYCYDLRGSCSRESMKSPFDGERIYLQKKFLSQISTFRRK